MERARQGRRALVLRRQVDRGRLQPPDPARPRGDLRQGRGLRQGGQRRSPGLASRRQPDDEAHHRSCAHDRRQADRARQLRPLRRPQGGRLDAHPLDPADPGQVRPEGQDEDLGLVRLRREVRRRARADGDGDTRADHRPVHDRLRGHDRSRRQARDGLGEDRRGRAVHDRPQASTVSGRSCAGRPRSSAHRAP